MCIRDSSGGHRADPDAVLAQLGRPGAGERLHPGLGRAVRRLAVRAPAHGGGDVDDRAGRAGGQHRLRGVPADQEGAGEQRGHHPLEVLERMRGEQRRSVGPLPDAHQAAGEVVARVVDAEAQRRGLHGQVVEEPGHRLLVGDVRPYGVQGDPVVRRGLHGGVQAVRVTPADHGVPSSAGEMAGDGRTEPPASPGDQGGTPNGAAS